jgi:hypothetical protein
MPQRLFTSIITWNESSYNHSQKCHPRPAKIIPWLAKKNQVPTFCTWYDAQSQAFLNRSVVFVMERFGIGISSIEQGAWRIKEEESHDTYDLEHLVPSNTLGQGPQIKRIKFIDNAFWYLYQATSEVSINLLQMTLDNVLCEPNYSCQNCLMVSAIFKARALTNRPFWEHDTQDQGALTSGSQYGNQLWSSTGFNLTTFGGTMTIAQPPHHIPGSLGSRPRELKEAHSPCPPDPKKYKHKTRLKCYVVGS